MSKELIERVAKAIYPLISFDPDYDDAPETCAECCEENDVSKAEARTLARAAIAEYEAAKQEAQDAEDERLYTEFHK